jgi:Protein of unknown function (DUF998)
VRTRSFLRLGALAGPVFVGTYTVTGRRLSGYDRRRDPVSALARTEVGWIQTLNFLVSGSLTLAGSVGIRRASPAGVGKRSIPMLVAAVGAGLLGAGVFATDLTEETAQDGVSRRGALHVASAVPFFVGLPTACVISAYRFAAEGRGVLAAVSVNGGVVSMAAATLAGAGFAGKQPWDARAGTYQRIAIAAGLGWLTLFVGMLLAADRER